MARVTMKHGATMDVATVEEIRQVLAEQSGKDHRGRVRVRAEAAVAIPANAINFAFDVYTIPTGFEFEARRVILDLDEATSPGTGNVPLSGATVNVRYLRSGTRIEYANPQSPSGFANIPGVQTWGVEQGPYLVNGETFQIEAGAWGALIGHLRVSLEGVLSRVRAQ